MEPMNPRPGRSGARESRSRERRSLFPEILAGVRPAAGNVVSFANNRRTGIRLAAAVLVAAAWPAARGATLSTPPEIAALTPDSGPSSGGTPVAVAGYPFQVGATLKIGPSSATGVSVAGLTRLNATTPALPAGTLHEVVLTNGDAATAILPGGWFADYSDVPSAHPFHAAIEKISRKGITTGCGSGNYCPDTHVTRGQMAVFLLRAKHGAATLPPPATGTIFTDVPAGAPFARWIEQLSAEGITGGCGGRRSTARRRT